MRVFRVLAVLFAATAIGLFAPAAASAVPYPAAPPDAAVSDGTVAVGGQTRFFGKGFQPGETVNITITYGPSNSTAGLRDQQRGAFVPVAMSMPIVAAKHTTAASDGTFTTWVTLTQNGTATLTATGLTSGTVASATVQVGTASNGNGQPSTPSGTALPKTGTSGRLLAVAIYGGLGAVLLGAAMVWLTMVRRRRTEV